MLNINNTYSASNAARLPQRNLETHQKVDVNFGRNLYIPQENKKIGLEKD